MIVRRLEALWWLTRLYLNASPVWLVTIGWLAAGGGPWWRLALLYVFVVTAGSAHMILNDILDVEPDRVTAPYLPLPAGLLTVDEARRGMILLGVIAAGSLVAASPSIAVFAACAGLVSLSAIGTRIYSSHKAWGAADSLFVGLSMAVTATIGWLIGGHEHVADLAIIAPYGLIYGFTANTWAALRDLDRDGLVGNLTLPVRVGGARTVRIALVTSGLQYGLAAGLLALNGLDPVPVAILVAGLSIQAFAAPRTHRQFDKPDLGRPQRLADLRLIRFGETLRFAGVVAIYSVPAAVIVSLILELSLTFGGRAYRRRIIDGELGRLMEVHRDSDPQSKPQSA
jgi:4-hydroxybenzoate polyprenyltransferase